MKTKLKFLLFALLACCASARAQTWSTVTATHLTDQSGNNLPSGTICFLGTDANDNPIPFSPGGAGQAIVQEACAPISAGAIVQPFQVANPASAAPVNLEYRVIITSPKGNLRYNGVQFTGSPFNFDNYIPTAPPIALGQTVSILSVGQLTITGSCSGCGGAGSSIFTSFQFGSNAAITGSANYLQLAGSAIFNLTQSGSGTSGSPYVDTIALASQSQNLFLASPNGSSGVPGFRGIVAADLPASIGSNTTGNAATATALASTPSQCGANNWTTGIAASGNANCSQPGFGNLSGSIALVQTPLTTLGDVLYVNATPALARLAGNTSAIKNFLTQTGNGTISAAPAWGAIAAGDIPSGSSCSAGQYMTGIAAGLAVNCAQVAYSQVSGTPSLYYQTVQNASGTAQTQRPIIQFTGSGVSSVADDSANNRTVVTITGGSGSGCTVPGGTSDLLYDTGTACGDVTKLQWNSGTSTISLLSGGTFDPTAGTMKVPGSSGQLLYNNGGNLAAEDPIVSYNYVNLVNAAAATATQTGGPARVSTFGAFGTLYVTLGGLTGTYTSCQVQMKNADSLGNLINNGSAIALTMLNGVASFNIASASGLYTTAQLEAVYSCSAYGSAGTISLDYVPGISVAIINAPSVAQSGIWSMRLQDGSGNAITSTSSALDVNLKTSSITLNVSATESGVWTVQPGNTANTTPWLVGGNLGDNGAAATTNRLAVLPAIAESNMPSALTAGRDAALRTDRQGNLLSAAQPSTSIASYTTSKLGLAPASSATDVAVLPGNASNTVIVTGVKLSCTQTTAGIIDVQLVVRSTADSAGTSAAMTTVPNDSNNSAAASAPLTYTANPTTGTMLGVIDSVKLGCMAPGTASPNDIYIWRPSRYGQSIVLRGTAQQLAINLNGATVSGASVDLTYEWEETTGL